MTWFAAPLVLALAVTSTQTPLPGMTHAEGLVAGDTAGAGRLLVNVAVGELTLRTRYAHTTRVVAGQSALMTGATSVPWAAAFTPNQLDPFAIWSDTRMAASGQTAYGAGAWAASGLSSASLGSSPPCTGGPSWTTPCWELPLANRKPWRSRPLPPPSYAPNDAPNYAPNFNVLPGPGSSPGGGGAPPRHPPQAQPRPQPLPQPPSPPNPPPSQARPAARERPSAPGAVPRPPSR